MLPAYRYFKLCVGCRGVRRRDTGSSGYFSVQPATKACKCLKCTPWQYCRIFGLELPTSPTFTGVSRAAGQHKRAAAKLTSGLDSASTGVYYVGIFYI